jgi:DNA-binding MarR family transcriptional regulator
MKHRKYASKSDERRVRAQLTEKIRRELETNSDDKKTKDKSIKSYNNHNKDKTSYKRYKK